MKKFLFMLLMGLLLLPSESFANYYESDEEIPPLPIPVRMPNNVSGWIDSNTGVFTILSNYDITNMHVTITQNNVLCDEFTQDMMSGVPAIYNFGGYAGGEYLLTIEDENGLIIRYRIKVVVV